MTHTGKAVALPVDNIDTDQLIPARFMSRPRAQGYGDLLLHDFRKNTAGEVDADFVLNRFPDASVLIAGSNFGTGSSREAAVYALVDAGIQVVIATGFGDIFTSNAINNGLLPARIDEADYQHLQDLVGQSQLSVCVDLQGCRIDVGGQTFLFQLNEALRTKLINGWDDIDLTLAHVDQIAAFREKHLNARPWSMPVNAESKLSV